MYQSVPEFCPAVCTAQLANSSHKKYHLGHRSFVHRMETSRFPVVHWTPHDYQHSNPEYITGVTYEPAQVPPPSGISTTDSQHSFGPLQAATDKWGDSVGTESSTSLRNCDFFALQSDVHFADDPPDGFSFQLDQAPGFWVRNL